MNINQVYQMDCIALMQALPDKSIGAILTDPPYGLAAYKPLVIKRPDDSTYYARVNEAWDMEVPLAWMDEVQRVLKPGGAVIVFNGKIGLIEIGYRGLQLGWRLMQEITWFKPDAPPNFSGRMVSASCEKFYWYVPSGGRWTYDLKYAKSQNNGGNFRDVWEFSSPRGEDRVHPTQKPLALLDRIVRLFTKPNDVVLDPFMGSGTTLVAAKNAGRQFIGCDLDAGYCEIASKRLQDIDELPLFAPLVQAKML